MDIRYGTREDAFLLAGLGAKTFYDAFAKDNKPEDIESYLRQSFSVEIQHQELSDPGNVFLIAENGDTAIGYAQLVMDSKDSAITVTKPVELRRIYVLHEYVGQGIGKELMAACIREARERGRNGIWLGVWEKNQRAIEFYEKWGFRQVGVHRFLLGSDPQNDFIMELELA